MAIQLLRWYNYCSQVDEAKGIGEKGGQRAIAMNHLKSGLSGRQTDDQAVSSNDIMAHFGNISTPRCLEFHRNSALHDINPGNSGSKEK
jgi:hypothetical protein